MFPVPVTFVIFALVLCATAGMAIGALSGFLLLHLSVINFYFLRRRSGEWLRHLAFPLVGFLVIAYVLYQMDSSAKAMGIAWVIIGAIYYFVVAFVQKKRIAIEM